MTIQLPANLENELRQLAQERRRDLQDLVQDAIRQFIDASAITDLDSVDVAQCQIELADELPAVEDWPRNEESNSNEAC